MNPKNSKNPVSDKIIEYGIISLILVTPLAFGSVHVWAYTLMELTVLCLLLTWLLKHLTLPAPRSPLLTPCLFLLLFLGLILFQMVPLPATVIKHLSPNTYDLYKQTLGNGIEHGAWGKKQGSLPSPSSPPLRPLTIYGHATKTEFLKFFVYGAVFFLILNTIKTSAQIKRLVLTIILTGTSVAFLGILQMLSKSDKIYGFWQSQYKIGSYGGPFVNANHFAGYLEMIIPLALGFLVSRKVPRVLGAGQPWGHRLSVLESWLAQNVLLIFIIVVMGSGVFLSLSRGGIISFLFSLVLFSSFLGLQKHQKEKRKMVILVSGLLFIFLLWLGVGPVVTKLATLANLKTASVERPQVWKDTLHLFRDFPLFGVGLGNFQNLYPKYTTIASPTFWDHAHNDYLEMLADTGWVGVLLFFGGVFIFLFTILKKWKERRDPFVIGITLGGLTGAVAILFHSLVEFNLRIPANALLLFIILGLIGVTVNLKKRPEGEYSLLPVHSFTFSPKIAKTVLTLTAVVVVFLVAVAAKDFLAYHVVANSQSLSLAESPANLTDTASPARLKQAIFLDSGNAEYHNSLGNYYAQKITEAWKQGAWKLIQGRWVFMHGENTQFFGLNALKAYGDAVHLSPTNAWYHFYLGWTLNELQGLSEYSENPMPPNKLLDARIEFSRALMLDPNNTYIKDYLEKAKKP